MKKSFSRSRRRLAAFGSAIMLCLSLLAPFPGKMASLAQAKDLQTETGAEENGSGTEAGANPLELLDSAIHYAEQYLPEEKIYTKESLQKLKTAYAAAKKTAGRKNLTEAEAKEAYLALEREMASVCPILSDVPLHLPMRDLSAEALISEMGTGITLEDAYQLTGEEDLPVSEFTHRLKEMGFRTVRIPVDFSFWATETYPGSTVDRSRFSMIASIVDAAVSEDLYVIITPVLSEEGREAFPYNAASEDPTIVDSVKAGYADLWKILAEMFRDQDEHVIFEAMNAPYGRVFSDNDVRAEQSLICDLDRIFVNTVRATGGNNQKRYLAVTGYRSNIAWTVKEEYGFTLPEDPSERLMVSVQYTPREFGLDPHSDKTSFHTEDVSDLQKILEPLKEFTDRKIPVLLSDYRSVDKGNDSERAYYLELVNVICRDLGVVPVYGNREAKTEEEGNALLIRRADGAVLFPECIDAIMRGMDRGCDPSVKDVEKAPDQKNLTGIVITADTARSKLYPSEGASLRSDSEGTGLYLKQGESFPLTAVVTPSGSTDPVIYTSSNEAVFTVSAGVVRAKSIGDAVLYVSSKSGSAKSELPVHVSAADLKTPLKSFTLFGEEETKELTLLPGDMVALDPRKVPEESDAGFEYYSADRSVAYVTPQGRIYASGAGKTVIVAGASNGMVRYIPVTVCEPGEAQTLDLRLKMTLQGPGAAESATEEETSLTEEISREETSGEELSSEEETTSGENTSFLEEGSSGEMESPTASETETIGKNETETDSHELQKYEVFSDPVRIRANGVYRFSFDLEGREEQIAEALGDRSLWEFVSLSLAEDTSAGKKAALLKGIHMGIRVEGFDACTETEVFSFPDKTFPEMGVDSPSNPEDTNAFEEKELLNAEVFAYDCSVSAASGFRSDMIPKRIELLVSVQDLDFEPDLGEPGPKGPEMKSASPTSFSMVVGESTDISVKLKAEGAEFSDEESVIFLSSDRSIARVEQIPVKIGADARAYASVTATEPGTTTIKAISKDLKVVTFTVKVTKEPEIVETGKEPEETTKAPEKETEEQQTIKDPPGNNALEVIMLGVLLGVIVLFLVIGTMILLKSARNK